MTHSSVNFTLFPLFNFQKFANRSLFKTCARFHLPPFWITSKEIFLSDWNNFCSQTIPNNVKSTFLEKIVFFSKIPLIIWMTLIYIYIYIVIHRQTGIHSRISLTFSRAIRPYHPSLLAGLPDYILCLYWVVIGKFLFVSQHWHVHVWGAWENVTYEFVFASSAVSCMSCSSYLDGFRDWR